MNIFKEIKKLIRRHKLRQEKAELIVRHEYLINNGFPVVFNGRNKIKEKIDQINQELTT